MGRDSSRTLPVRHNISIQGRPAMDPLLKRSLSLDTGTPIALSRASSAPAVTSSGSSASVGMTNVPSWPSIHNGTLPPSSCLPGSAHSYIPRVASRALSASKPAAHSQHRGKLERMKEDLMYRRKTGRYRSGSASISADRWRDYYRKAGIPDIWIEDLHTGDTTAASTVISRDRHNADSKKLPLLTDSVKADNSDTCSDVQAKPITDRRFSDVDIELQTSSYSDTDSSATKIQAWNLGLRGLMLDRMVSRQEAYSSAATGRVRLLKTDSAMENGVTRSRQTRLSSANSVSPSSKDPDNGAGATGKLDRAGSPFERNISTSQISNVANQSRDVHVHLPSDSQDSESAFSIHRNSSQAEELAGSSGTHRGEDVIAVPDSLSESCTDTSSSGISQPRPPQGMIISVEQRATPGEGLNISGDSPGSVSYLEHGTASSGLSGSLHTGRRDPDYAEHSVRTADGQAALWLIPPSSYRNISDKNGYQDDQIGTDTNLTGIPLDVHSEVHKNNMDHGVHVPSSLKENPHLCDHVWDNMDFFCQVKKSWVSVEYNDKYTGL